MQASAARIEREVASWDGVTVRTHPSGGLEFRLGTRELGRLRDRRADLPFRRPVRDMLVETGRALLHHERPGSSRVSKPIETDEDAVEAIELFRLAYERARVALAVRAARGS